MGLSFIELLSKINEAGPIPTGPPNKPGTPSGGPIAGPPQTPPAGGDPLGGMGGAGPAMPPMSPGGGPDPLGGGLGGGPTSGAAPAGKPKIIKITTVWDALENILDGKIKKAGKKENPPSKQKDHVKNKSIYT